MADGEEKSPQLLRSYTIPEFVGLSIGRSTFALLLNSSTYGGDANRSTDSCFG